MYLYKHHKTTSSVVLQQIFFAVVCFVGINCDLVGQSRNLFITYSFAYQTPKNLVLLRKYRSRGDGFELVPENPDWGTSSDSDGTKIIGVMVEHRRYWKR